MPQPVIDYYYSAHSAFAYLGSAKLTEIARAAGATIRHVPILLTPVIEGQGAQPAFCRTLGHIINLFGRQGVFDPHSLGCSP